MTDVNYVEKFFAPIKGKPCWSVQHGHGSMLTFEFGQPHLRFIEPTLDERKIIIVHGDCHLWIYCCYWTIELNDKTLAHDESSRRKTRKALRQLDGAAILSVSVDPMHGTSEFEFELGAKLITEPYRELDRQGEPYENWLFFDAQGHVLTYRADGSYSYHSSDEASEEWQRWL